MTKKNRTSMIVVAVLVALAIPLYAFVLAPLLPGGTVAAARLVTVDINPSIELTVNPDGVVTAAKAVNDDGKKVLDAIHVVGMNATDAVKLIVETAVSLGFVDASASDNYVEVGVEEKGASPTAEEKKLENDLKGAAEQGLANKKAKGTVGVSALVQERITAAKAIGISPGRLNLIDRLAETTGQTREQVLAQYGESSVKDIMKAENAARHKDNGKNDKVTPGAGNGSGDWVRVRYVALLRGINVGPSKRIPMADLKRLFEERRFLFVATFLQSGNVRFDSPLAEADLLPDLERAIADRFGFVVPVLLRTEEEFRQALQDCPFTPEEIAAAERDAEGDSYYVAFLRTPPTEADRARLAAAAEGSGDRFAVGRREVYLLFRHTIRTSKLTAQLERLSSPATTRNGNSAARIAALFD